jgi:hypothetical protein
MKYAILISMAFLWSCSDSYNSKMNGLLRFKKEIETRIDSNKAQDDRFREITGYSEIDDSIGLNKSYPHPELVDSIQTMKFENELLVRELQKTEYSIDSLQKLK